jgi:hypothetical protein
MCRYTVTAELYTLQERSAESHSCAWYALSYACTMWVDWRVSLATCSPVQLAGREQDQHRDETDQQAPCRAAVLRRNLDRAKTQLQKSAAMPHTMDKCHSCLLAEQAATESTAHRTIRANMVVGDDGPYLPDFGLVRDHLRQVHAATALSTCGWLKSSSISITSVHIFYPTLPWRTQQIYISPTITSPAKHLILPSSEICLCDGCTLSKEDRRSGAEEVMTGRRNH